MAWLSLRIAACNIAVAMMYLGITLGEHAAAAQPDWQLDLVDAQGDVGMSPALVLDSEGNPRIAYYDRSSRDVLLAWWDGVMWHYEAVEEDIYSAPDHLPEAELAFARDPGNEYQVLYEVPKLDRQVLRHAEGSPGVGWTLSQVDVSLAGPGGPGMHPSIAIDANRVTHVLYARPERTGAGPSDYKNPLIYGRLVGALWQLEGISGTSNNDKDYGGPSLAIDADGKAHVSYDNHESGGSFSLRYARRDGLNNWLMSRVDPQNSAGNIHSSIGLDYAGQPHICYCFRTAEGPELRYARWDGATWQIETVTTGVLRVSLVLDPVNTAHIAYILDGSGHPVYARRSTQGWETHEFDRGTPYNPTLSLAVDVARNPQIAFQGAGRDLYLYRFDEKWQVRSVDDRGDASYTSIAIDVKGAPNISYSLSDPVDWATTGAPYGLCYAVRRDGDWLRTTVAPSESMGRGRYSSIAIPWQKNQTVGYPRIASYRPDTGDLEFSYFNGALWRTDIVFDASNDDSADDVGLYSSLVAVPGQTNIAYWDNTNFRVKFAWKDLDGWHVTHNPNAPTLDRASGHTSLVYSYTGVAEICYFDAAQSNLGFTSFDINDRSWWTEGQFVGGPEIQVGLFDFAKNGGLSCVWHNVANGEILLYQSLGRYDPANDQLVVSNIPEITDVSIPNTESGSGDFIVVIAEYPFPLKAAVRPYGLRTWTVDVVDPGGATDVSVDNILGRPMISYRAASTGELRLAFPTGTLEFPYNALQPCESLSYLPPTEDELKESELRRQSTPLLDPGTRDDLAILRGLRDYFIQSDEGIRLLNLYYAHSLETGAIGLSSPTLTRKALDTIRNYLPGFLGLVNGEGDKYLITQSMVDQVNEVWDVLVADGSTSLSTAINTERAKYNNLQDFVGMNFNQWAEALGVREKQTAAKSSRSYR